MHIFLIRLWILLAAFTPLCAQAYIGPGMGLGVAATVVGLFVAFILLVVGLIWLPIRRLLRHRKSNQQAQSETAAKSES